MDYAALAKQFGGSPMAQSAQPVQQQAAPSWMNDLSMKDQAALRMKSIEDGRKRIGDLDAEIAKAEMIKRRLERFGELNRQTSTGGLWDAVMPGNPALHGDDVDEMYSIQAELGPSMRAVGSGASSDRDVNLFLSGIPGVEKSGAVNKNLRGDFNQRYDYAVNKKTAMEQYLNQNGTLDGFDSEWANSIRKQNAAPAAKPVQATKQSRAFNMLPNAKQYDGKTATDTVSGKRYRSQGGKWVEAK